MRLPSLVAAGLLSLTGCAVSKPSSPGDAPSARIVASDPVCGPPGTRSGTWARLLPFDHPALLSTTPSALVGRMLNVEGQPVLGLAQIWRDPPDTTTVGASVADSLGYFAVRQIPAGRYRLRLLGIWYMRQEHQVYLVAGMPDTICVRMRATPVGLAPVGARPIRSREP